VPIGDYTIERLGRDVIALMDHARIARADLCGISIGGITALWLATHLPERVNRVVLSNTAARIGSVDMWNQRIALIRDEGMAALADATMGRWFTARYHECEPQTVARIRATFLKVDVNGYAGCCAALREADLRSVAGRTPVPALVISGAHDLATPPADGRWLATAIPGARFVELDAAHLSNIERADEFNEQVLTFLKE
jgi:3-oxoadipate enol-lactonase